MTLRLRLAIGFVLIAIILVGPLAFAIQSLEQLHKDARTLRDRDFAASILISRLREGLNAVRRAELALLFTKTADARTDMGKQVAVVTALADSLRRLELPQYASDITSAVAVIAATIPDETAATLAENAHLADSISSHVVVPAINHADQSVARAEHVLGDRTRQSVSNQASQIVQTERGSLVAMALALLVAAGIAIWLTRSISEPIVDLKRGMRSVADGDLTYTLKTPANPTDEFGQLASSFQEMTRQLTELDKLKAEFVSIASHELKTPINVIMGYLQLLEEGVYGALTPKQQDVHKTLTHQANMLQRLVKQLLDVSRFEAGGSRVEPRRIVLSEMLQELENAFHVLAVQREVHFHVVKGEGLPDEVYWDADRMNEVLGNLLSNAFKFTPRGGSIDLTLEPDPRGVSMEVKDTGAGIAPEQLPRIFEKFYQADNQGAARAVGTGLGLAIAKQIIDAHGGTISCDSTPGVGTAFHISLPTRVARRSSMQRALSAVA